MSVVHPCSVSSMLAEHAASSIQYMEWTLYSNLTMVACLSTELSLPSVRSTRSSFWASVIVHQDSSTPVTPNEFPSPAQETSGFSSSAVLPEQVLPSAIWFPTPRSKMIAVWTGKQFWNSSFACTNNCYKGTAVIHLCIVRRFGDVTNIEEKHLEISVMVFFFPGTTVKNHVVLSPR